MLTCNISIAGKTFEDLLSVLKEVERLTARRFRSGRASHSAASYEFATLGDVEVEPEIKKKVRGPGRRNTGVRPRPIVVGRTKDGETEEPTSAVSIKYICPKCEETWEGTGPPICDSECPKCGLKGVTAFSWTPIWYCQSCGHEAEELDFVPSDGNPAPHVCPNCGRTDVFFKDPPETA